MKRVALTRLLLGLSLACCALAVRAEAPQLPAPAATRVDFGTQVAPLLQKHCLACHAERKAKGGLRLDTREHAMKGGYSGVVIQPGKSGDSRLIHVLAGVAEDKVVM